MTMTMAALAGALVVTMGVAQAQPAIGVTAGAGVGQLWDDETRLGTGPVVTGGLTVGLGDRAVVSGSVDALHHTRALTYLGVDGDAITGLGRLSYVFGAPGAAVRPLVGAGLGVLHSSGTLRTPAIVVVNGQPTVSTTEKVEVPWSLTRPMWDAHAGLRLRAGSGVAIQPEVRWRATFGSTSGVAPGGIEPPLLGVQGLVSVEWRLK